MKKMIKFVLFMLVLGLVGGVVGYRQFVLADYTYTGESKTISDVFVGKISITGNDHRLTIRAGSVVPWVTIVGSDNLITIEKGAQVDKIRGLGGNNTIVAPPSVEVDASGLKGNNNTLRSKGAPSLDGL